MRTAKLICLFAVFGNTVNAQLTILPHVGIENPQTNIGINNFSSFSPAGPKLSPQAGIRLDYKFRQLHGPFLGISTSRSVVKFNFSDPQRAMENYTASRGSTQIRLEAGYQVSTKPIYFRKAGSPEKSAKFHCRKSTAGRTCGNPVLRNSCRSKVNNPVEAHSNNKGLWVSVQPSLGVAYQPFGPSTEIFAKTQGNTILYEYNAGNWKTAMISGIGFEFGRNEKRALVVSVNYLRSLGNAGSKSISAMSGNKPVNTSLKSDVSGWSLRVGIPISINKKKPAVNKQEFERPYYEKRKCILYKMRCRREI